MRAGLILTAGSPRADVELAKRAEAAGFHGVYTIEFFNRHGFAALGAIAEATSRVQIGTAIANAFTRTPLLHASAAMDLDELSEGRFVLGLGSGTRRMNQDWYGVEFSRPAARMQELVELLRAAFDAQKGGGFRWEGEHWKLKIPIYARPGAVRDQIPSWHREVMLPTLREAEEQAGRAAGACALYPYVITSIQEKREDAVSDAKKQIGFYFTTALYHSVLDLHGMREVGEKCTAALRRFDTKAMAEAIPDELVDEIAIACTPDEARDRLAQWKDLTDHPLFYAPTVGVHPERVRANTDAMLGLLGGA
jgi:alkanesulfonate monooxygenase SsuD/methylene tetrahydromethanopterin reductase-like flavin-dependent oxidoreductase (luciferase family)